MARQATIIARKGSKWESVAVGSAREIRDKYKHDNFAGFEQVHYLDTSGGHRRKKGTQAEAKPAPKKK